ncbi:ash family protein [Salmonella enterica]|nr:ash family protein [Salmonella enterica]EJX4074498.1 ash family protein [Salmonella enterica]EJX4079442.1 ash family protein [Salmonella enterica]EJX4084214.1 ash family protein [Salmonella enterica]EJX4089096.1 ash family protein [Salmonella enterica]
MVAEAKKTPLEITLAAVVWLTEKFLIHAFPVNRRDTSKPPQFKRSQQTAGKQEQGKLMTNNITSCDGVNISVINRLHWLAVLSYAYPAPQKTGAGIGTPILIKATPDAASVFFVVRYTRHSMAWCAHLMAGCSQAPDLATAHRAALIMVTLAGQPQGWPVPFIAGSSNPVNVTALFEIGTSSGDSLNQIKEAVYYG